MTILLNLSTDYKININKEITVFDLVISPFRDLEFKNNQTLKKMICFNSIFKQSILMNQYFWIINLQKDVFNSGQKISKVIIYHDGDNDLSEYKGIVYIEFHKKYMIINNSEYIRVPTYTFYDKNGWYTIEKYLEVWLWFVQEKLSMTTGKLTNQTNLFSNDEKIIEFKEKIINNINFINGGNEGILLWEENYSKIKKQVPIKSTINKVTIELYKNNNVIFCKKKLIPLFYEDGLLKIKVTEDKKYINFTYQNFIIPLSKLDFVRMARLLIRQRKTSIFIDDNKVINYGKIRIPNTPFFETVYNDLGNSFIQTSNKNFQDGLIRDVYFLVKNHQKTNHRNIISSKRQLSIESILKNDKGFSNFFNFVTNEYKYKDKIKGMPMVCHESDVSKNIDKYNEVYTCNAISTMNRLIEYKDNKKFVYEMKSNNVYECKSEFENNNFEFKGFEKELSINLEIIDGAKKWIRK